MAINIAGIGLSSTAGATFSIDNGATPWLKVDASGRLSRQQSVYFQGHLTGQGSNYLAANVVMGAVNYNVGSAWNNSTGKFTCPIAGRYIIGCGGLAAGLANGFGAANGYFCIAKNGVNHAFSHWNSASYWQHVALSAVIDCVIGDTMSFAINTAPSPATGSNGWYGGDRHGNFFVGLIK